MSADAAAQRADPTGPPPLAGFTVVLTAARRREELGNLLERRGARVVHAPAIRIVPLEDDAELHDATRACLDGPLDHAVATTGIGFRGWMEAADGWGLGDELRTRLRDVTLLARGPKARGAIRAAGLTDAWSPESESSAEVLAHLLASDLSGARIAVQLHGEPLPDFVETLRAAGADVVEVPVYRWTLPEDVGPLRRAVELVAARGADACVFTSAPAVASTLQVAESTGHYDEFVEALRGDVLCACVGPVTAARLDRLDVPSVQPARARLGALVREIVERLPPRVRPLRVAGRSLEVRAGSVLLDGEVRELSPGPLAVLHQLARRPGVVVSRSELQESLPREGSGEHAVEMAVARLRSTLGAGTVQTVVKRGYRLGYEPDSGPAAELPGCCGDPTAPGQRR